MTHAVDPQHPDGKREQLRAIVADMERDLLAFTPGATELTELTALRASWRELVTALDLGPSMETRICPACKSTGMRAASRCGRCWSALAPYAAAAT